MNETGTNERTKIAPHPNSITPSESNSIYPSNSNPSIEKVGEISPPHISIESQPNSPPYSFWNRMDNTTQETYLEVRDFFPYYESLFHQFEFLFNLPPDQPFFISSMKVEENNSNSPQSISDLKQIVKLSFPCHFFLFTPRSHLLPEFLIKYGLLSHISVFDFNIKDWLINVGRNSSKLNESIILPSIEESGVFKTILMVNLEYLHFILSHSHERSIYSGEFLVDTLIQRIIEQKNTNSPQIIVWIGSSALQIHPKWLSRAFYIYHYNFPDTAYRLRFFETLATKFGLSSFNAEIMARFTEKWNLQDLFRFFIHSLTTYQISARTGEKLPPLDTSFFIHLLETDEYRPYVCESTDIFLESNCIANPLSLGKLSDISTTQGDLPYNREFEIQLYQDAASRNYDELSTVIDKLQRGALLQPFERLLLADYAFILKDDPQKALQKLNNARVKMDRIMRSSSPSPGKKKDN